MTGALSAADLAIVTPEFIRTVGPDCRVAYINAPAEWTPEDDEFSRSVAKRRGGNLEVFITVAEAEEWLQG